MAKTKKPFGGSRGKAKKKPARKAQKQQYTPRQKYMHYAARVGAVNAGESNEGISKGDPRYSYALGFTDGYWWGENNEAKIRSNFGERSARAYAVGRIRGKKALSNEQFKKGVFT